MKKVERQRIIDVVEDYIKSHREVVNSSIETYSTNLRILLEQYGMTEPTREQWLDVKAQMDAEGKKPRTKKLRKQVVKHWAAAYNIPLDISDIKLGKLDKNRERILSPEEERNIIKAFPCLREKAAAAMLIGTGMRIFELETLRVDQVCLKTGDVKITCHPEKGERTKNGEDRRSRLRSEFVPIVTRYLCEREKLLRQTGQRHDYFLIILQSGKPLKHGSYRVELWRQAKVHVDPVLGRHFHSKMGRRIFITRSAERGVPPTIIQQAVGHSSFATTAAYLEHDDDAVSRAYGAIK